MAEEPTASMKPQETVIFLLGELKGSFSSLQTSVDNNNRAQADINAANEVAHEGFRKEIGTLALDVGILKDSRLTQRYTKTERTQKWMVYAGIPTTLAGLIALFVQFYNK